MADTASTPSVDDAMTSIYNSRIALAQHRQPLLLDLQAKVTAASTSDIATALGAVLAALDDANDQSMFRNMATTVAGLQDWVDKRVAANATVAAMAPK